MDDEGVYLDSGENVPALGITPIMIMDKTNVVYGPSGTGKTVIVKNLMAQVRGHIEQILIISPTESANRSYEGFVDPPLVHYRLFLPDPRAPKKESASAGAQRFLQAIWSRQEALAAVHSRANNPETLAALFGRLPADSRAAGQKRIHSMNRGREQVVRRLRSLYAGDVGRQETEMKKINEKFRQFLVLLYKKFISPHTGALWATRDLSESERYSLQYLQVNPRLLLIFDDCAAELKPLFSREIFRKLFYQNRHCFITVILCCQDDTDLPANLRKNAFISFFTTAVVATSYFERQANNYPKPMKQLVGGLVPRVFQGHRKLAYIREDDRQQHFYHVTFPVPRPERFGSAACHELCNAVKSDGVSMDKDNPFYDRFKVGP